MTPEGKFLPWLIEPGQARLIPCEECGALTTASRGLCETCEAKPLHGPGGSPGTCSGVPVERLKGDPSTTRCPQCGWEPQ